jgi:CRP-like cAMP-binding protein
MANERIQALSRLDVAGRVAHELLAFAEGYGVSGADGVLIPLRLTQSDLAALVGASRERVNQALGEMRKRDLVSTDGRYRITVRDPAALARWVL